MLILFLFTHHTLSNGMVGIDGWVNQGQNIYPGVMKSQH